VTEASKAVFLSYASEDAEAARRMAAALRAAGLEVWFDKSELRGGDAWDRRIRDQIRHCALFIPVISSHSQARLEGYFRREWKLAVERMRDMADERAFLLPVAIDGTPERGASVPEAFHDVQWTRLRGGEPSREFVDHVSRLLTHPDESAKADAQVLPPIPVAAPERRTTSFTASSRVRLVVALAVVIAVTIGYIGVSRYHPHKSSAPSTPSSSPSEADKSIAVLPFVDLSERKDQEYFADGLAEEVLSLLATLPDLKVIARTSSFQFKGRNADLRTIGAALGVAYVVEGSVRRNGGEVRVTAQLIDTRDGVHRWSETYDRQIGDILRMQQDIAAALARALQIEIGGVEWQRPATLPNAEAYTEYLRGLHAMERYNKEGFEVAISHFERALDLDPNLDRAREAMAGAHFLQYAFKFVPPADGAEKARSEVDIILAKDPRSAYAHGLLARLLTMHDWDWAGAKREADLALSLDKNGYLPQYAAADLAAVLGHWDESERLFRRAVAVDPLDADTLAELTDVLYRAGRLVEAEKGFRHLLEIRPSYSTGYFGLGTVLVDEGRPEEALAVMQHEDAEGYRLIGCAVAYHALQRKTESDAALRRAERDYGADLAFMIGWAHAHRGELDAAFDWLERAYMQKDYDLPYVKGVAMLGNGIEKDPRWSSLMRKLNLPE